MLGHRICYVLYIIYYVVHHYGICISYIEYIQSNTCGGGVEEEKVLLPGGQQLL